MLKKTTDDPNILKFNIVDNNRIIVKTLGIWENTQDLTLRSIINCLEGDEKLFKYYEKLFKYGAKGDYTTDDEKCELFIYPKKDNEFFEITLYKIPIYQEESCDDIISLLEFVYFFVANEKNRKGLDVN
jgi:hypothetical protein